MVEDDDSFAEALRELLEADGRLEVVGTARDGREAIELAEVLRPDVVLMDIVLPVMDGVEATREIRRRQPTIPVVGITGSEYEERALEVQDAGAVDSSARAGETQISSNSLSLPHVTAGAAAVQRAAEQRSSQRTNLARSLISTSRPVTRSLATTATSWDTPKRQRRCLHWHHNQPVRFSAPESAV